MQHQPSPTFTNRDRSHTEIFQASSLEIAPACNAVAQTYVQVFDDSAPYPFAVAVGDISQGVDCLQFYSGDGTPGQ